MSIGNLAVKRQDTVATAVTVQIILTDGEHIHDRRVIHPGDFASLNEAAQAETDGELWWEMRPFDAVI